MLRESARKLLSRTALVLLIPVLVVMILVVIPFRHCCWVLQEIPRESVKCWRAWRHDFIQGRLGATAAEKEAARKERMDKIFRKL